MGLLGVVVSWAPGVSKLKMNRSIQRRERDRDPDREERDTERGGQRPKERGGDGNCFPLLFENSPLLPLQRLKVA